MFKQILMAAAVIGFSACTFRCDDEGREKRASVEFETEEKEIDVPDIDIKKERKTIEVPSVDLDGDDEEEVEE